jgi:putative FmdB family regulatory protein
MSLILTRDIESLKWPFHRFRVVSKWRELGMPIYEYECTKCGRHTEALQKFSDPPLSECELCHGKLTKLISQSTFHLKGSGWYVTDYASKSGGNQGAGPGSHQNAKPQSSDSTETSKKQDSASKGSTEASNKKASTDK